jgi:hypothetical protein
MVPPAAREQLLAGLQAGDVQLWSIIGALASAEEMDRRRILRPHEDAGFTREEAEQMDRRRRLDTALGTLTLFEVGRQLGLISDADLPLADTADLGKLFASQGFLRYTSAYLYFGIRFLAGRLDPPLWMRAMPVIPRQRDSNERPIALETPPEVRDVYGAEAAMVDFLALPTGSEIDTALLFLDGFTAPGAANWTPDSDYDEPEYFELWLLGLWPELHEDTAARFTTIANGISMWAQQRSNFYLHLETASTPPGPISIEAESFFKGQRPEAGWNITNPVAARFGLLDIYWMARLLRADVTTDAQVSYKHTSWLRLLRDRAARRDQPETAEILRSAEDILRSVFDLTCDLIQNAVEITSDIEQRAFQPELRFDPPPTTAGWRETFDEELDEIEAQRRQRKFMGPAAPVGVPGAGRWSKRVLTGESPRNLVGLAFSGGGIRSATFNLGVLQGLQEFDLLRWVDYLSTVSGGGFIGSWLSANVHNTTYWLGRLTNWDESIAHLRRYSKYLAPSGGLFSADTWTMWFSWLRNAFLIQLTSVTCLATLLLLALLLEAGFQFISSPARSELASISEEIVAVTALAVAGTIVFSIGKPKGTANWPPLSAPKVRRFAVVPALIGSGLIASLLWSEAVVMSPCPPAYSFILLHQWQRWLCPIAIALVLLLWIGLFTTSLRRRHAPWIAAATTGTLYLEFCGILWLLLHCTRPTHEADAYVFVFGPALVLLANAIGIVLFIGFSGRNSAEWIREWWTRFGSWLAMYGGGVLLVWAMAVLGPYWTLTAFSTHWQIATGTSLGWIGTVVSGLMAGKSSKTSGEKDESAALQMLAKVAGALFIVGALLLVSTLVYILLVNIATQETISACQYWNTLHAIPAVKLSEVLAATCLLAGLFSWFFEINIFGLSNFYRNRLVRCYLGASRWAPGLRSPQPFTGFDQKDDLPLGTLRHTKSGFRGPFPILNCSLNLGGSSDLALHTRHSASFSLTPLRCGSDRPRVGYAPTSGPQGSFAGGVMLGQAVAVSGAAASPNMGYNTSPLVAFLLTMFNVRLGWWFANPGRLNWRSRGLGSSVSYLVRELFGAADETSAFVNVSDGGHFENLGIYELVRRGCKVIIASDAECDEPLQFGSLGNVVRICETDFGAKIDLNVGSIRQQTNGYSLAHCAIGKITYSNGSLGWLIYLKASVTGDEDVGVAQYRSIHPAFPHETTANQFFSEDQFESYRRLGEHVVRHALRDIRPASHPVAMAEKLYDTWAPVTLTGDSFVKDSQRLDQIWERFRQSPALHPFLAELMGASSNAARTPTEEELSIGLELIQLMEDTFLDLRLDDFWEHPDNRGWAMLFAGWARSRLFRAIWAQTRRTFGIRFEYFCEQRLGLPKERPIARV